MQDADITIMNDKIRFALLAIGLIASLGIAASDCINLYAIDRNQEGISGAKVYVDSSSNFVGETNSSGYLLISLDNITSDATTKTTDNVWNITTSWKNKVGWATVTVPHGTCQNVTISMLY